MCFITSQSQVSSFGLGLLCINTYICMTGFLKFDYTCELTVISQAYSDLGIAKVFSPTLLLGLGKFLVVNSATRETGNSKILYQSSSKSSSVLKHPYTTDTTIKKPSWTITFYLSRYVQI